MSHGIWVRSLEAGWGRLGIDCGTDEGDTGVLWGEFRQLVVSMEHCDNHNGVQAGPYGIKRHCSLGHQGV